MAGDAQLLTSPLYGGFNSCVALKHRSVAIGGDHEVALKLKLYEREWHFYESRLSAKVPVRVPKYLGSVLSGTSRATTASVVAGPDASDRWPTFATRAAPRPT